MSDRDRIDAAALVPARAVSRGDVVLRGGEGGVPLGVHVVSAVRDGDLGLVRIDLEEGGPWHFDPAESLLVERAEGADPDA